MRQFTEFVDKLVEYFENSQSAQRNTTKQKWFHEYMPEEMPKTDLWTAYDESIDCGTRSSAKEMLDTMAEVTRAKNIRDKKRVDFFVDNVIRLEGTLARIENKKILLSDQMI